MARFCGLVDRAGSLLHSPLDGYLQPVGTACILRRLRAGIRCGGLREGHWTIRQLADESLGSKDQGPTKPVSIPRLGLCGALLAARLLRATAGGLGIAASNLHAWSDAKVVLAWLRCHPTRWKPFVANRVATIQDKVPPERWRYVPTGENPDLATRGITPSELAYLRLWWRGPHWLEDADGTWPTPPLVDREEREELRSLAIAEVPPEPGNEILANFLLFSG